MIDQFAFHISEVSGIGEVRDLLEKISSERRTQISRFRFETDKMRSLFAEVLLRYALKKRYGIEDLVLKTNEYGKPFLKDHEEIFFNLSHSGDWVVCGIGDRNLGIDVERIEDIEMSIARDFFAKEEWEYIRTIPETERLGVFYRVWTLKECYTKNVGKGMSIPLDSFYFAFSEARIDIHVQGVRSTDYTFQTRDLDDRHKLALCVSSEEGKNIDSAFTVVSLEEIRAEIL